jgi:hypothetical protein
MRLVGLRYWDANAAMTAKAVRVGSQIRFQQAGDDARTDVGEKSTSFRAYCGRYHLGHMPHFASALLRSAGVSSGITGYVTTISGAKRTLEITVGIRSPVETAPKGHTLYCPQGTGSGVYAVVNVRDMRAYIGQTANLDRRRQEHLRLLTSGHHPKAGLQKDWREQPDAFAFVVVDAEATNLEEAERYRIYIYGTTDQRQGYNQGEGFLAGGAQSNASVAAASPPARAGAARQGTASLALPARVTLRSVGMLLKELGFQFVNNRTAKGGSVWVFNTEEEFGHIAEMLRASGVGVKRYPTGRKKYEDDHYEIDPRKQLPQR